MIFLKEAGKHLDRAKVLSASIRYFVDEGRQHATATFRACKARLRAGDIRKLLIFTLDGSAVLKALPMLKGMGSGTVPQVIAVSFPPETSVSKEIPGKRIQAGIVGETYEKLHGAGVVVVQGTMPLREIVIPGDRDIKIEAIRRTFWSFSGGMDLCVEAVLMACDAGHVQPGEIVMACSADTAITARACRSTALLSGLEVQEIICKPRHLTITRRTFYEEAPSPGQAARKRAPRGRSKRLGPA